MKSTVVDESLSSYKPMYCSREYQTSTRLNQQYEKSTLNSNLVFQQSRAEEGPMIRIKMCTRFKSLFGAEELNSRFFHRICSWIKKVLSTQYLNNFLSGEGM